MENKEDKKLLEELSGEDLDAVTGGTNDLLHPHILRDDELEALRQGQTGTGGQQMPRMTGQ